MARQGRIGTTKADALAEQLGDAAGEAIARWLEGRGKLNQPIRSLEKHELIGLAWAAISAYLEKREELGRQEANRPPPTDAPLGI